MKTELELLELETWVFEATLLLSYRPISFFSYRGKEKKSKKQKPNNQNFHCRDLSMGG